VRDPQDGKARSDAGKIRAAAAQTLPTEVSPEFWGSTISVLYLSELLTRSQVSSIISEKLSSYGLVGKVSGRPKHFYSIYKKMKAQSLEFEQVYDVIAFRIILATVKDCYEALGIIHSLWKPVPGRFKDYIAMPKANGYQSLHTTVIGPYGERVEIQIRTEEMNQTAEEGIAAHWRYKDEDPQSLVREDQRLQWLREMVELFREQRDPKEFLKNLKINLIPEEVYVFTHFGRCF
jgi:GTP pyrophosphokinase